MRRLELDKHAQGLRPCVPMSATKMSLSTNKSVRGTVAKQSAVEKGEMMR